MKFNQINRDDGEIHQFLLYNVLVSMYNIFNICVRGFSKGLKWL